MEWRDPRLQHLVWGLIAPAIAWICVIGLAISYVIAAADAVVRSHGLTAGTLALVVMLLAFLPPMWATSFLVSAALLRRDRVRVDADVLRESATGLAKALRVPTRWALRAAGLGS